MKFAANLSLLWPELPFLDRFDAAAQAGFDAVEILFPYDTPAPETQAALGRNGLSLILINAPPPNYTGGARGFAAQPDMVDRFRHDMRRAFRYAGALGVPMIHVMAGEAEGDTARATFIDNLRWAAAEAPSGMTLTIEPLNPVAMPGYFLNDYAVASDILTELALPNVALQYDSYHAQMIHGDAVAVLDAYRDFVVHVQIGDSPDRSAPGSGQVDFAKLFARLEATGYRGYVSAEYHPGGPTEKTLSWMNRS
ncbi:hydroxypyruvate isomerase [Sulfitobacter alexandrii]|uniref:Hydroxypyruvate isomerase n=1 Tax=Sulfitobacter alexandrii TaxID=1917485 RepID=A0A1J0WKU5_9RHOB|nr:TIM barrel protein [Sulfitobacter alexandrii]APE44922.1 hydroxypyruvate isomerase [Sulfitobacter alexandrii]